jgi:hypothetical protein
MTRFTIRYLRTKTTIFFNYFNELSKVLTEKNEEQLKTKVIFISLRLILIL